MTNLISKWRRAAAQRVAIVGALALTAPVAAWADLLLYPTRVVLESRDRGAQIQMVNRGTKPETYRIKIVNRRMTETGEIVVADKQEPNEHFADSMLVYTPRQVTLQPGMSQTVRIAVRRPAGLADGEYRSHLQIDRIADASASNELENVGKPEKGQIAIVLQALIGASFPVIVRQGKTAVAVTLDDLRVTRSSTDPAPMLGFVFHRNGNRSVYGNVEATYAAPGKKPVKVASVDGVAVYVPNTTRVAMLPLTLPKGTSLRGGTLTLRYAQPRDAGGAAIAERTLAIP